MRLVNGGGNEAKMLPEHAAEVRRTGKAPRKCDIRDRLAVLRLQFLAGMGLNLYQSDVIYSGMLAYAHRFPDELFIGSPETLNALRAGILREQGR